MSDFTKVNFETKENKQAQSQLLESLLQNPYIAKLCKREEIPLSVIRENPYQFKNWLENIEPCRACKSLNNCKQGKKGYRLGLQYDGLLHKVVEACPYQVERETGEKHLSQFRINDLSPKFTTLSFTNLPIEGETSTYIRTAKEIVNLFYEGKGAYIYGNMGTGKTYLSACGANDAARDHKTVVFVHYPTFCTKLARMQKGTETNVLFDQITSADFAVLDDIGAEEVTPYNRAMLLSLLDKRMQSERTTWFTSNSDFEGLLAHFSLDARYYDNMDANRVMERIRVLAKPVYLDGNDRRHLNE